MVWETKASGKCCMHSCGAMSSCQETLRYTWEPLLARRGRTWRAPSLVGSLTSTNRGAWESTWTALQALLTDRRETIRDASAGSGQASTRRQSAVHGSLCGQRGCSPLSKPLNHTEQVPKLAQDASRSVSPCQ